MFQILHTILFTLASISCANYSDKTKAKPEINRLVIMSESQCPVNQGCEILFKQSKVGQVARVIYNDSSMFVELQLDDGITIPKPAKFINQRLAHSGIVEVIVDVNANDYYSSLDTIQTSSFCPIETISKDSVLEMMSKSLNEKQLQIQKKQITENN